MSKTKDEPADTTLLSTTADDMKKSYTQPRATARPGFRPGHIKVGGRKPGSPNKRTKLALEICEELNFHPAAFLATIALTGLMPNPDGSTIAVSTDDRLKAATALAPFVMPRLQATQVTGKDEGPVETATLDITKLLQDPEAVEAAQKLALMMAKPDLEPAAPRAYIPGDTYPEK